MPENWKSAAMFVVPEPAPVRFQVTARFGPVRLSSSAPPMKLILPSVGRTLMTVKLSLPPRASRVRSITAVML